ncbi:MAG TPA: SLBB domain-containing protein [Gemmatimonadales bacterium]
MITIARNCALAAVLALAGAAGIRAQQAPGELFRPGDRILLAVDGEQALSDTFTVTEGPAVALPGLGAFPLSGVRRGDIEGFLTTQLTRYLVHPVVHARALIRVGVLGELTHPGFYALPADALVSDALMAAGGLTRDARFGQLHIDRDGHAMLSGAALQAAITRGETLDHLGLHSGDAIVVPRRRDMAALVQILGLAITVPAAIYGLSRIH